MPYRAPARHQRRKRQGASREYNRRRRNRDPGLNAAQQIYNTKRWKVVRLQQLGDEPLCRLCAEDGLETIAVEVDHIVPLRVDLQRAFDKDNLQSVCHACHQRKSTSERGRYA